MDRVARTVQEQRDYHETLLTLLGQIQHSLRTNAIEKIEITDEFVILMIKLASIDPVNKFLIKQQMVISEVNRMTKVVVNRITGMSALTRDIITMQLWFKMNYISRDDSSFIFHEDQDQKVTALVDELKTGIPAGEEERDMWYAKLLGAIIIEADMGHASDIPVLWETEAALRSVFPKEDLSLLESISEDEREKEVYLLVQIASGIRLYYRWKLPKTYGAAIPNLTKEVPAKISSAFEKMEKARQELITRLIRYTTIAQPYFLRMQVFRVGRRAVSKDLVTIRQGLVMVHQVLIYLKQLSEALVQEKEATDQLVTTYKETMEDVQDLVTEWDRPSGTAFAACPKVVLLSPVVSDDNIPRRPTFPIEALPKFDELAETWRDLQECQVYVSAISEMLDTVVEFADKNLPSVDEIASKILGNSRLPSENDFFSFKKIRIPEDKYALAKRSDFRPDLSPLQMNLSGFCVYSLVQGIGLLLLSNTSYGMYTWKNRNYLLGTPRGVIEFRRDPETFINKVYAIARKSPELISLLKIEKEAYNPSTVTEFDRSGKTTNIMVTQNGEAQTELHPTESNILHSYTWNEWELRRRGLILSKIHKCSTHGTQTHWQALKHSIGVQTYPLKSRLMQTGTGVYNEIPLSQFYLYGLRGLHCGVPPHVVEITQENPMDLPAKVSTTLKVPRNPEDPLPRLSEFFPRSCQKDHAE